MHELPLGSRDLQLIAEMLEVGQDGQRLALDVVLQFEVVLAVFVCGQRQEHLLLEVDQRGGVHVGLHQ